MRFQFVYVDEDCNVYWGWYLPQYTRYELYDTEMLLVVTFLHEASFGRRVFSLPVSVCVCVYLPLACLHDISEPVQIRITKFEPTMQNDLGSSL